MTVRRALVAACALTVVAAVVPGCRWLDGTGPSEAARDFGFVSVNTDQPPPWQLDKVGGGRLALGDLKGQVALLYFWTTW